MLGFETMKAAKKPSKTKVTKKSQKKISKYPRTAGDAFVNQKMLYKVRDELIAYTDIKFHEVKSEIHAVKAELHEVRAEIHELRAEIHAVKAELQEIKSDIHELKSQFSQLEKTMHKVALLVEEQNNRNKIVLDGLAQLFERQERIEKKVDSSI
jgi:chromosome segregation ATPase